MIFGNSMSQTLAPIISIEVNYKINNSIIPDTNSVSLINGFPEAVINLSSTDSISRIYLKIISPADNVILYNVNYNINSETITNSEGFELFSRNNTTVHINSPNSLTLTTYWYELITEDTHGNLSTPLSEIH